MVEKREETTTVAAAATTTLLIQDEINAIGATIAANEIEAENNSADEDAFDRLIKKTYDRDCEKFFQRIDKLKRMNSCGGSS